MLLPVECDKRQGLVNVFRPYSIEKQTHHSLALLNVLFPKEELAVEIGEVYRVEVEESDVAKACEDDVFHYIPHRASEDRVKHAIM